MSIERGVAKSALWAIAMRLADRLIGLVSLLVLARLLTPSDYGLVAMAMSLVALLEALTAFGFEWAIIQKQTSERAYLDTAWSFNVVLGILNAVVFILIIPVAVRFFDEVRIGGIMFVLAAAMVINGFRNVGMVLFEKDLRFGRLFLLGFSKKVMGFTVTLTIAITLNSYWALVFGQLAIAIVDFVMTYVLSPYRPRVTFSAKRDIAHFAKWMYLTNLLTFCNTRATHLIIGNQAGATALGTYNVSYEVANLPTSELLGPMFRALFPGFSQLTGDVQRLRTLVMDVLSMGTLVAFPAAAGIAILSEPLVALLLGSKWLGAGELVKVLAVFGGATAIFAPLGAVNLAVGRVDVGAKIGILGVLLTLPVFAYLVSNFGLVPAAWGLVSTRVAAGGLNLVVVMRWLSLPLRSIITQVWRPFLGTLTMLVVLSAIRDQIWSADKPWSVGLVRLFALIGVGFVGYVTVVYASWIMSGRPAGGEANMLKLVRKGWENTCGLYLKRRRT